MTKYVRVCIDQHCQSVGVIQIALVFLSDSIHSKNNYSKSMENSSTLKGDNYELRGKIK